MTPTPVYLDHAATTPPRTEVLARMAEVQATAWGNPSSPHAVGRAARAVLDEAHESVAAAIGAEPRAIVFTSGGTEAINLAIKGAAWAGKATGHRIITSAAEHDAVLNAIRHLEKFGFEVVILGVDRYGRTDPDELARALTERTILVSLQLANNEVGTVGPTAELIARTRAGSRALIHVDAVQAAPWLPIDVMTLGADLVSLAGHKLEGPKGIGALWIRRGIAILPQQHGGSQERYRRAGTEHVAGAAGMARALELIVAERATTVPHVTALRDRILAAAASLPGVELTGHPRDRLPNHASCIVRDAEGEAVVVRLDLDGICASTGSACTSGSTDASHVLTAMGFPHDEARGALRLSVGRTTTDVDIDRLLARLPDAIAHARESRALSAGAAGAGVPAGMPALEVLPGG
ncbi:MAG: cysteine desulfurase family protein [Chloroflexota bacterium]